MRAHPVSSHLDPRWRELSQRMLHATVASLSLLLLLGVFLTFLEQLWVRPFEGVWAGLIFLITLDLLLAQWRLATYTCPRCQGFWISGPWALANPFALHRNHCPHCGLKMGEDPGEPKE